MVYEFFSCSTNIPRGLSAYNPQKLVVYCLNATEERFNSTRSTEGRDLYLTEIISDIGELSHLIDCHGVCGNNNEISFVTNLLVKLFFCKNVQFFICLVVSSSRLLFTFHVFSFKRVLISILIWHGFMEYQNRKKSTISFGNRTC